jgi:hypothetical protein|tara:strand:- start:390 stop:785 length:396 start_codon:yes stop_codon:yes gene_type:complete
MRATINFDVDVDRVQETMTALVLQEVVPLHQAMDLMETTKPQDLYDGISKALEILGSVSTQLEQYRDMITSFEKARFETLLPQPAQEAERSGGSVAHNLKEVGDAVSKIKQFEQFLEKAKESDDSEDTEEG